MSRSRVGRSFYGFATVSTLLVAGGAISLVASARQSSPSPAQTKKVTQVIPSPANVKQVPLPGFDKSGAPASPSASGKAPQQGQVVLHEGNYSAKSGIAKGQDAVYTDGDMKFTGQSAVYNTNTLELDTTGNLVLDDPKHHVTGDKAHVDRNRHLAVMTGNIVITLKPTPPNPNIPVNPDAAKQRQYPVIITCDRAEDSYKKNFIVLTGHLIFKQTIVKDNGKTVERTVTSEHAEYDGKAEMLHLFQPVKAYDSEGQKWEIEKDAFVGTKEGEETLTTPGKSTLIFNSDEADDDDKAADKTSTGKQTGDKRPPEKKETPPPPTPRTPN